MKHEYNTAEVAKILGRTSQALKKYADKGYLKRTPIEGKGRNGIRYIYSEEAIQALADRIGVVPDWEASGRTYSNTPKAEEPEEVSTVLHEWVIIQMGKMWLTDNMSLTDTMDKAKRFGTSATEAIRQHCTRTGGIPMLVQTIIKEMRIEE